MNKAGTKNEPKLSEKVQAAVVLDLKCTESSENFPKNNLANDVF